MPRFLAALLSLLAVFSASGSSVPPEVVSVVSGGYWTTQDRSGTYRVVVTNSGFDHVTSRVVVEWVADPGSAQEKPVVVAAVEPKLPFGQGVASLSATLTATGQNHAQIKVSGVVAADPSQRVKAVVSATSPGHVAIDGG